MAPQKTHTIAAVTEAYLRASVDPGTLYYSLDGIVEEVLGHLPEHQPGVHLPAAAHEPHAYWRKITINYGKKTQFLFVGVKPEIALELGDAVTVRGWKGAIIGRPDEVDRVVPPFIYIRDGSEPIAAYQIILRRNGTDVKFGPDHRMPPRFPQEGESYDRHRIPPFSASLMPTPLE